MRVTIAEPAKVAYSSLKTGESFYDQSVEFVKTSHPGTAYRPQGSHVISFLGDTKVIPKDGRFKTLESCEPFTIIKAEGWIGLVVGNEDDIALLGRFSRPVLDLKTKSLKEVREETIVEIIGTLETESV